MIVRIDHAIFALRFLPLVMAGGALSATVQGVANVIHTMVAGPKVPSTFKANGPLTSPFIALAIILSFSVFQLIPWLYYRHYKQLKASAPETTFLDGTLSLRTSFVLGCSMYAVGAIGIVIISNM